MHINLQILEKSYIYYDNTFIRDKTEEDQICFEVFYPKNN